MAKSQEKPPLTGRTACKAESCTVSEFSFVWSSGMGLLQQPVMIPLKRDSRMSARAVIFVRCRHSPVRSFGKKR